MRHLALDHVAAALEQGIVAAARLQQPHRHADRRERVAQLVREDRQEFVLALVGLAQRGVAGQPLGDVLRDDEARRSAFEMVPPCEVTWTSIGLPSFFTCRHWPLFSKR